MTQEQEQDIGIIVEAAVALATTANHLMYINDPWLREHYLVERAAAAVEEAVLALSAIAGQLEGSGLEQTPVG